MNVAVAGVSRSWADFRVTARMRALRAGWLAVSTLGAVTTIGLRAFTWDTAIVVWRNHLLLCGLA